MAMNGDELQRPYAAPANVNGVLQRVRTRNLPERIDDDLLRLAGVPEGAMHRVHSALRFLRLVGTDGRPTDTLAALAAAPEDDYRTLLEGVVREAYRTDFDRIDPTKDSQAQIAAAFQPYQPRSQINRMVILFLGLCREAGITVVDAPRDRKMTQASARPSTTKTRDSATPNRVKGRKGKTSTKDEGSEGGGGSTLPFGITEADIALMDEDEFAEVWSALGTALSKVARVRDRARRQADVPAPETDEETGGEG